MTRVFHIPLQDERGLLAEARFSDRPHQLTVTLADDLSILRAECVYATLGPVGMFEAIEMRTWTFLMRKPDARLGGIVFVPDRKVAMDAFDELREAFRVLHSYARSLPIGLSYKSNLTLLSHFLLDRWSCEESLMRPLLRPPSADPFVL